MILTPNCPVCDEPPALALPGGMQSFCGNDDCMTLCWNPSKSIDDNLLDTEFVQLPVRGEDDL